MITIMERQETMESDNTGSTETGDMEKTIIKLFEKLEIILDPQNVGDCQSDSQTFKTKRRCTNQTLKKYYKGINLSSLEIRMKV